MNRWKKLAKHSKKKRNASPMPPKPTKTSHPMKINTNTSPIHQDKATTRKPVPPPEISESAKILPNIYSTQVPPPITIQNRDQCENYQMDLKPRMILNWQLGKWNSIDQAGMLRNLRSYRNLPGSPKKLVEMFIFKQIPLRRKFDIKSWFKSLRRNEVLFDRVCWTNTAEQNIWRPRQW